MKIINDSKRPSQAADIYVNSHEYGEDSTKLHKQEIQDDEALPQDAVSITLRGMYFLPFNFHFYFIIKYKS